MDHVLALTNVELPRKPHFENTEVLDLLRWYRSISSHRNEAVFRLLVQGLQVTTLSCVPDAFRHRVLLAKLHLALLITLYDDLADNPEYRNLTLLEYLCQLNVSIPIPPIGLRPPIAAREISMFDLARSLVEGLVKSIAQLPNGLQLRDVLAFDIQHIFLEKRFSGIISQIAELRNLGEIKKYGYYGMGLVALGMIDLMASPLITSELTRCREVFRIGQRVAHISNLMTTLDRERIEQDVTNEIMIAEADGIGTSIYTHRLRRESARLLRKIQNEHLRTFSTATYVDGFRKFHNLYVTLKGSV
jgi:hypothetical protein